MCVTVCNDELTLATWHMQRCRIQADTAVSSASLEVAEDASFYASWPGRLSAHFAVFLGKLGRSMQLA